MKTLHIWDLALLAATCTSALSIPSKHEGYDFTPEMYDMEQIIMEPLNKLEEMLDGAASTVGKVVDSVFPPVPPPGSPPPRNHEDETIYQIIEKSDKFKYLTKALQFSETGVKALNDSSKHITFFAPPDSALRSPHRRHGIERDLDLLAVSSDSEALSRLSLPELSFLIDELEATKDKDDDDKEKERRRKIAKAVVGAILRYHSLPHALDSHGLAAKTTHATVLNLHSGILAGQPTRIKVEPAGLLTPASVNVVSKITHKDIKAKNGYLHVISFPLLPPAPAFQELFIVPSGFATFTSAIQRVQLADKLDIRWDHEKHELKGTNVTTVFVPSNEAFRKLPLRLRLFLFSPFGERILKKLLEFHVVPNFVFHSDYTYNSTSGKTVTLNHHKDHEPNYTANLTTLLPGRNGTLPVSVTQYNLPIHVPGRDPIPYPVTIMNVNGLNVRSKLRDLPALNGAVHVVHEVLNPMHGNGEHHHHHDHEDHHHHDHHRHRHLEDEIAEHVYEEEDCESGEWEYVDVWGDEEEAGEESKGWEGWEEWLPKWADES
ncbi:hypothetical protein BDV98DRAFT_600229 [Pterulicium gracile]|uniref:FAS1 domain-containing protein n=1 Tax=Pterulicium gracile TaxID=1884261 RepID=A0A5C3QVU8_9AGAR|nr:hypothetical protein BDV98DRAFT_600229 [Pterula gracilis]